jgi:glycosyltransferase involved in cell wall biosynthesis
VNLLEAMAQGKPLIATDMGEQREIIQNGVNGYLVTAGDIAELAARIGELLADPAKRGRMSAEARRLAQQYSVDAYTRRLQSLYAELAGNGTGAGARTGRAAG